jgi:transposase
MSLSTSTRRSTRCGAQEHRELIKEYVASELTGTKFDWLRTSSKTDNRTGNRPTFIQLSRTNPRTARAWRITVAATLLWDYSYLGAAEKRWKELFSWISRSKLEPMIKVGKTIQKYFWEILNAIRMRTSNTMVEAMNLGFQRIKRMACRFRNRERFRMAILFHFGGLDFGF